MSYYDVSSKEYARLTFTVGQIHDLRQGRQFKDADALRDQVLAENKGFRIRSTADRTVLEEWPDPLFSDDLHKGLNFGMFVTASDRIRG